MTIKWDIKQHTIHYNQMTKVIFRLSQAIDGLDSFGAWLFIDQTCHTMESHQMCIPLHHSDLDLSQWTIPIFADFRYIKPPVRGHL